MNNPVRKFTLTVIEKVEETENTVTLKFKQPGLKKIAYDAGQYLTLIFRINGRRYLRPYSLSSAPTIDGTLDVTIKRVQGGIVSNHIVDMVHVGDSIEVMEPMGDFVLQKNDSSPNKKIVLWGSGSGITPLFSIAKFALNSTLYSQITLFYGNKSFETTIFNEKIAKLLKDYPEKFSTWHFHTKATTSSQNPNLISGRIDPRKIVSDVGLKSHFLETDHFICGPVDLKNSIKLMLLEIGVPEEKIHSEDFEIIRDPQALENVITQDITLEFNHRIYTFEVVKGKTILEAGLDSGLELQYSCQTGNCLLCKARLLQGEIKHIGIDSIPSELDKDECLLCCSVPCSNDVKIIIE